MARLPDSTLGRTVNIETDAEKWRLLQAERLLIEASYVEDSDGGWRPAEREEGDPAEKRISVKFRCVREGSRAPGRH
jgi:hypothetical protein